MMKQTAMDSDELYFPSEIIRNILKRLPVKSLIRFRCVCKYWRNLIRNPSFITEHLQLSRYQNPSLLLQGTEFNIPFQPHLHLLDSELQVRGIQKEPVIDSWKRANIVGSCNGLVCLEIDQPYRSPSFLLWNPATREVRHVPCSRSKHPRYDVWVTGFGFSPIVDDYKIVSTHCRLHHSVSRVEVFSLSRGSWKVIDIGNFKGVKLDPQRVNINGAIFWSGVKLGGAEGEGEDEVEVIVSFDIANEVFTVIPRPDLDYNEYGMLTVYENKLAILCDIWESAETPHLIDLWVLDEGTYASGQTWRWTKRYNSRPLSCMLGLMDIWRNEFVCQPIFEEDNEKGRRNVLCLMNLTTNEVKRIVLPYCVPVLDIYSYVESLVSVGGNYIEES